MLRYFQSYHRTTFAVLLGLALLCSVPLLLGIAPAPMHQVLALGEVGSALLLPASPVLNWLLGACLLAAIGTLSAYSFASYRLTAAGSYSGLLTVLIGTCSLWYGGYTPHLLAVLALTFAGHRLFYSYLKQGTARPMFDCGLALGAAILIAPVWAWFVGWGLVVLVRLRSSSLNELVNLVLGAATLPLLLIVWHYVRFGQVSTEILWAAGTFISGLRAYWPVFSALVLLSILAIFAYASISARRTIVEQRAFQLWMILLPFGWLALLTAGTFSPSHYVLLILPLGVLIGSWILGRPARTQLILLTISVGLLLIAAYGQIAGWWQP